jgi:tetratricopeptide (TPR) repeat protein
MARDGLRLLACAGVALGLLTRLPAAPPDDTEAKVRTQLAVQAALQQGRDHLQRGNYQAAVYALESQVARVDGNREYLNALRDAYRGYVRELREANRHDEVPTYLRRLLILDPGASLEQAPPAAPKAPPPTLAGLAGATAPPGKPSAGPAPTLPPAPRPAITARGKEDDDPFADANGRQGQEARRLVERADEEFALDHFEAAGRLYEQASRADRASTAGCQDRWAYCKLYGVVQALNRPGAGAGADLEKEVRQALSMAPKLDSFGKDLLRKIEDRRGPAGRPADAPVRADSAARVEVRHGGREGKWNVAATTNFRVLHNQPRETAERVARIAEATRAAMTRKWFGEEAAPWGQPCTIYLHASTQEYTTATPAPPQSPGHSRMHREGERVLLREIHLRCDEAHMLDAVLPHETTHVILAGRFGPHDVPRWADEGMAVLSEPRERVELHLRNLPMHRRDRTLFPLGQLMRMGEYPEPRYIGPFYAQGVSLVEFLSQRNGPQVFTRFLREGLQGGYEPALRKYYNFRDFAELEREWQRHAFGGEAAASAGERQ